MPAVNWGLFVAIVLAVALFKTSSALLSQAQQRTSADLREYLAQLYGGIKAARLQNAVQQLDARINKLALMPAFADSPLSRDLDRQYQHLQEQRARYHKYQPIADINIVEGVAVFLVATPDIVPCGRVF